MILITFIVLMVELILAGIAGKNWREYEYNGDVKEMKMGALNAFIIIFIVFIVFAILNDVIFKWI